ncbi:MAG: DUF512 domain-containing protein [Lachnospiraceae bacterium]|nr:DUF512 domain-containing protein [Lachnospiraceae bacterium]
MREHTIIKVKEGSIAEELGIEAGDVLLAVNDQEIGDVFDFDYLCEDEYIEVLIRKPDGEEWLLEVDKDEDEELGLVFDAGLMDEAHSCKNKCIFCFIDQNPPGMRPTIYFKDDDTRLSFLQGNYVTLTNLKDADVERIIRYRMEPINISVHTMDPELRVFMLKNPRSGEVLRYLDRLYEADITMNGQIVLCKGVNDGAALEYSMERLLEYAPVMQSVSVVPVGLSRYREKLYPLEPFDKDDAASVIDMIEAFQKKACKKCGLHFVHASDEWYVVAEREVPEEDRYDNYLQLENGVGMLRLLTEELTEAIEEEKSRGTVSRRKTVSIACGRSPYPTLKRLCDRVEEAWPGLEIILYPIKNDFFGERITVSGLITGQDLRKQLAGKELGEALLIPQVMLRCGTEVFLDDDTVKGVSEALQKEIVIVKSGGADLLHAVLGLEQSGTADKNPYEPDKL